MLMGEGPLKEMTIQLEPASVTPPPKKNLVFKMELIFSLDCGRVGIKFNSFKLRFPSNTISF